MARHIIPQERVTDEGELDTLDQIRLEAWARGYDAAAAMAGNKKARYLPPEPGLLEFWQEGYDVYMGGCEAL